MGNGSLMSHANALMSSTRSRRNPALGAQKRPKDDGQEGGGNAPVMIRTDGGAAKETIGGS